MGLPKRLLLVAAAALVAPHASGLVVEVGTLTEVVVTAPFFKTPIGQGAGSCKGDGCSGDLTRDGLVGNESRWSCTPQLLTTSGEQCSIAYDLGTEYELDSLRIALLEGGHQETFNIYVDDELLVTWTGSGDTLELQIVPLRRFSSTGRVVRIVRVGGGTRATNISEVEIYVAVDGSVLLTELPDVLEAETLGRVLMDSEEVQVVEAEELGRVLVEFEAYDVRREIVGGCDPAGCNGLLTRDGSLEPQSRWSCSSQVFRPGQEECSIAYDLQTPRELEGLRVAFYEGDMKVDSVFVHVDGLFVGEWATSGDTLAFQEFGLGGMTGQRLTLTAKSSVEGLGITEAMIMVNAAGGVPAVGSSPRRAVTVAHATANLNDAANTLDQTMSTHWNCSAADSPLGDRCFIVFDLGGVEVVEQVGIVFGPAAGGLAPASISIAGTAGILEIIHSGVIGQPYGQGGAWGQTYGKWAVRSIGRYLRIEGKIAPGTEGTLAIAEVDIRVSDTAPAKPVKPNAALQKLGPIPLAGAAEYDQRTRVEGGCGDDGCKPFYLKDGINTVDSRWSCSPLLHTAAADATCTVRFDLGYTRDLRQIRLAFPDGRRNSVEFTVEVDTFLGTMTALKSAISSGKTQALQTWDVRARTNAVTLRGVFGRWTDWLHISEVEFLALPEHGPNMVPVANAYLTTRDPGIDGNGQEDLAQVHDLVPPTAFKWSADKAKDVLVLELALTGRLTAVNIRFPAGVSYEFDVELDGKVVRKDMESSGGPSTFERFPLPEGTGLKGTSRVLRVLARGLTEGGADFDVLDIWVQGYRVNLYNEFHVASTSIEDWGEEYPHVIGLGTGDEVAIMRAVCAVKGAWFDGVGCLGGDERSKGTVRLALGEYRISRTVNLLSGVSLQGRVEPSRSPYISSMVKEDDSSELSGAGPSALLAVRDTTRAEVQDVWFGGTADMAGPQAGPCSCIDVSNSKNIAFWRVGVHSCSGNGIEIKGSEDVTFDGATSGDSGPFVIGTVEGNRDAGVLVENSAEVTFRQYMVYGNGEAGIKLIGSSDFTYTADCDSSGNFDESDGCSFEGSLGSLRDLSPVDVVIQNATKDVEFNSVAFLGYAEPAIVVDSTSEDVVFNDCVFYGQQTCVVQAENPGEVEGNGLVWNGECFSSVQQQR